MIGASAGGVEALQQVVAGLPEGLPAAVCVVVHIRASLPSALPAILARSGPLPCDFAEDGQPLRAGEILIAPPNCHVLVQDGHAQLSGGPRENGHRPAIDVLFRAAAQTAAGLIVGVLLSGVRDDGTAGLASIKATGGAAIVQDPADALFAQMPANALANVRVDGVLPAKLIGGAVVDLVRGKGRPTMPQGRQPAPDAGGEPVISICPECGGVLSEDSSAPVLQWVCKIGHRYSAETLADLQEADVENNLWAVIRSLEDRSALLERMAAKQSGPRGEAAARRFSERAREAREHAQTLRAVQQRLTASTRPGSAPDRAG